MYDVYVWVCVMYWVVYTAHTYTSRGARTLAKSEAYTRAQQQQTLLRTYICLRSMYWWETMAALWLKLIAAATIVLLPLLLSLRLLLLCCRAIVAAFIFYKYASFFFFLIVVVVLVILLLFKEHAISSVCLFTLKYGELYTHDTHIKYTRCQQRSRRFSLCRVSCQFHFANSVLLNYYWN